MKAKKNCLKNSMDKIKELNLKEIAYLSEKFAIKYKNGAFSFGKNFSTQDIYEAIYFLKDEIWNLNNVKYATSTLENQTNEEVLYYWPPESLEPIDTFLERAGILNYKVVISDPLSWLCSINPHSEHSYEKDPESYTETLLEGALFLISLKKWIETDQLLLLPDIHLWDYHAWIELGEINKEIMEAHNLTQTPLGKELFKIGSFEAGVDWAYTNMRLMQQNATPNDMKKWIGGLDDKKAIETFKILKSLPREEREKGAVNFMA